MDALAEIFPAEIKPPPETTTPNLQMVFDRAYKEAGLDEARKPASIVPQQLEFEDDHTGRREYFRLSEGVDVEELILKLEAKQAREELSTDQLHDLKLLKEHSLPYDQIGNRSTIPELMPARFWHEININPTAENRLDRFERLKKEFRAHRELVPADIDPAGRQYHAQKSSVPFDNKEIQTSPPGTTPLRYRLLKWLKRKNYPTQPTRLEKGWVQTDI